MIDIVKESDYVPTLGANQKGECFLVQCMNQDELIDMSKELGQEYYEPNSYPAVIGAMEKHDDSSCKPVCMSRDSYEFMHKSEWTEPVIITYAHYKQIFEDVDIDQMQLYETLGMKT